MGDGNDYTVASARAAADRDELEQWVADFLASPGSDNAALGEQLRDPRRWWLGPLHLPIDQLHRLVGPEDAPAVVTVDEGDWRDDVEDAAERIADGWEPPPVVVSHRAGQLVLEDGNHRVEGLRRAGQDMAWAVIAFDTERDRENFVVPDPAPGGVLGAG